MIIRPDISTDRVPLLQLLTANATRQVIEDETNVHVKLKWPNDLVLETGKLGGILIESKILHERVDFAVVGIGLNINQQKAQLPEGATSIRLSTGSRFDPQVLMRKIVNEIMARNDYLDRPSSVVEDWWHNCIHRPPIVQVTTQSKSLLIGITRGIDETGALILETVHGESLRITDGTLRVL